MERWQYWYLFVSSVKELSSIDVLNKHGNHIALDHNISTGMSKRGGGGGIATVTGGLCDAYYVTMIEDIKTIQSEVKASKSD